jgi:Glu-tRNA(Gln) amidotransferase subunit E-like FAD-binding protein
MVGMTKYLISLPGEAMVVPEGDFPAVVAESHAFIEEAKAGGVYLFGGPSIARCARRIN